MEVLKIENIDIPIQSDGIVLKATIYSTKNTAAKAPWIINLPGLQDHRESFFVKFYTEKFANAGYYILSYDYRAHGETAKQTGTNWVKYIKDIFSDVHEVISWVLENQKERILDQKLALFGRSLGGALILTQGFIDERAKVLIPLCARYDYAKLQIKYPDDIIKFISPKYYIKKDPSNNKRIMLGHCKCDERIPFSNVLEIKEQLSLNDENVLIYEEGSHGFKGCRDDVFERTLAFLKKNL